MAQTIELDDQQRRVLAAARDASRRVAFKTDIGLSHHVNQDAGGAWAWPRTDGTSAALVVVADGVSAGRKSEDASRLTVEVIHERLAPLLEEGKESLDTMLKALMETAVEANSRVARRPHVSLSSADATTLVSVLCVGNEGGGVWCGDSRVYKVSSTSIERLTRDHSWAEEVVSHGIMTAEAAARDPRAHMITRWLGPPNNGDPGLESFRFSLKPGEVVLCCTDGLYMYFAPPASEEAEINRLLAEANGDIQQWLDRLIHLSLERGGRDNITGGAIKAMEGATEAPVKEPAQTPSVADATQTVRLPRISRDSG